jgi:hypothetical protein
MLIRTAHDRFGPVDGTGWRASSDLLELHLTDPEPDPEPDPALDPEPVGDGTVHAVAGALVAVDLDGRSRVLDVDLIDLPAELLDPLSRYAVPPRPAPGAGPVALDLDAAWLWIHVQDGHRVSRHRRRATVRFSFAFAGVGARAGNTVRAGARLVAVRAHLAAAGEPA